MVLRNTSGQAIRVTQLDSLSAMVIEKDNSNNGQGLEIYNRGSDVGLGVYNTATGIGQLISHVGDSTHPALDIFIAGTEGGPGLRINKSNDSTGEVVKLWNQGFSETLWIDQDRTDSSSAVIHISNFSQGLDITANNWKIDKSGNFYILGNIDVPNMDSSNPGVAGSVYREENFVRISDGTNNKPFFGTFQQQMHLTTAGEDTTGFYLSPSPISVQGVRITTYATDYTSRYLQVNKQIVGGTGAVPDFDVLNTNVVHFKNDGTATGLSENINVGDILIIGYDS
jgi:hypothetical protein